MRGSVYCHGWAKLKSDPGLCTPSQVALKRHSAQETLSINNFDSENYSDFERDVHEGKLAEDQICNYVDTIMTAVNLSPPSEGEWTRPDIHPCKKEVNDLKSFELEQDYSDLVNTV